jgi:hypothetical protein
VIRAPTRTTTTKRGRPRAVAIETGNGTAATTQPADPHGDDETVAAIRTSTSATTRPPSPTRLLLYRATAASPRKRHAPPSPRATAGPRPARTLTKHPTNPAKPLAHTRRSAPQPPAAPRPASHRSPRPAAPPSPSLPLSTSQSPPSVRPISTAPHPTRPSTNCILCRALTPPEHLYGVWGGSGPGTGRKPPIHRESGVDTESAPTSTRWSPSPDCSVSGHETAPRRRR